MTLAANTFGEAIVSGTSLGEPGRGARQPPPAKTVHRYGKLDYIKLASSVIRAELLCRCNRVIRGRYRIIGGSDRIIGGSDRIIGWSHSIVGGRYRVISRGNRVMGRRNRVVGRHPHVVHGE